MKPTIKNLSALSLGVMLAFNASANLSLPDQSSDVAKQATERVTKKVTSANLTYVEIKDGLEYNPVLYSNDDSVGSRDNSNGLQVTGVATPIRSHGVVEKPSVNCGSKQYTSLCNQLESKWLQAMKNATAAPAPAMSVITHTGRKMGYMRKSESSGESYNIDAMAKKTLGNHVIALKKGVGAPCSGYDKTKTYYTAKHKFRIHRSGSNYNISDEFWTYTCRNL